MSSPQETIFRPNGPYQLPPGSMFYCHRLRCKHDELTEKLKHLPCKTSKKFVKHRVLYNYATSHELCN